MPTMGRTIFSTSIQNHPARTAVVTLSSAARVAASIAGPQMFVQGIEALQANDQNSATQYFGIYAALLLVQEMLPLLQAKLLIPMGTEISQELMTQAGKVFFKLPESTASQARGETYEIANIFGACAQPGATAFSLLPVTLEVTTNLTEILTLNIYMGIRLGRVVSLSGVQSFLYFVLAGPLLVNNGSTFVNYIAKLYEGFSRTVVFANHYVPRNLFNQQEAGLTALTDFMQNDLNPKTEETLNANAFSMLMPTVMGAIIIGSQLIWAVQQQLLNQKEFILLVFYAIQLQRATQRLMAKLIEAISSWGLFHTILSYINRGEIPNEQRFKQTEDTSFRMEKVSYTYPKTTQPVIKDFSLDIPSGQVVALIGENGNGKSTLFKMPFGFVKPDEGKIFLGGQDITTLNPDSYREVCAFVPQVPVILDGTFKSNIACRYEVSDDEVEALMREVGLENYKPQHIIEFGHEGPKISGGERQRVMLARAILAIRQGVRFLFVDEGFASLSEDGEQVLLNKLYEAICAKKVTTVMITHDLPRLQRVINFDQIIIMPRQPSPANRYHFHTDSETANADTHEPAAVGVVVSS